MSSYLEERFPHVVQKILETWGNPKEFSDMFNDLIFDARGGRSGWPVEAWQELEFLNALHKQVCLKEAEEEKDEPLDDTIKWVS